MGRKRKNDEPGDEMDAMLASEPCTRMGVINAASDLIDKLEEAVNDGRITRCIRKDLIAESRALLLPAMGQDFDPVCGRKFYRFVLDILWALEEEPGLFAQFSADKRAEEDRQRVKAALPAALEAVTVR